MVYQWFPRLRNFVWKWLKNNTIRFEISARVTLGSIVGLLPFLFSFLFLFLFLFLFGLILF